MSELSPFTTQHEAAGGTQLSPPSEHLRQRLAERLLAYDIFAPEAEHLRPHQVEGVQNFLDTVRNIIQGRQPNQGMSLLHPTGSGKTVLAGEMTRVVTGGNQAAAEPPLKTIMLVPGYQILNQTTGGLDEAGVIRTFQPKLSIGEYSGRKKETGADLTVMNYQALRGAIARGDIDRIDPALIICDEGHHVIDGKWAEDVLQIAQGRILAGMTATPGYTESRDMRRIFPNVLAHKTLREGIEEGILAELRGFIYQGSSKIVVAKGRKEFSDEEIFAAIADSKDNYLAAAICAGEVSQGRRGIVSCAPGFDRAHAKIMAKILNHTPIKSANGGQRYIRAAYVDGETHRRSLHKTFRKYREHELDVLTYIDLLREGWDSPETEFGVMLRPTLSSLLSEQRIGRLVRPWMNKIATLHEIVYEVEGINKAQKTHLDILDDTQDNRKVVQGRHFGAFNNAGERPPDRQSGSRSTHIFDVDKFVVDSGLIAAMSSVRPDAVGGASIEAGQHAIPFGWNTAHLLAAKFRCSREEVMSILADQEVTSQTLTIGEVEHTYYAPAANRVVAQELGVPEMPEGPERPMTLSDLVDYIRDNSYATRMRPETIRQHMLKANIEPAMYITDDNRVVMAYPYASRDVPFKRIGEQPYRAPEKLKPEITQAAPHLEVINWLAGILVNPQSAPTERARKEIRVGQSCLLVALREKKNSDENIAEEQQEELGLELTRLEVEPTEQMKNVMQTQKISFVDLVFLAQRAHAMQKAAKAA